MTEVLEAFEARGARARNPIVFNEWMIDLMRFALRQYDRVQELTLDLAYTDSAHKAACAQARDLSDELRHADALAENYRRDAEELAEVRPKLEDMTATAEMYEILLKGSRKRCSTLRLENRRLKGLPIPERPKTANT